MHANTDAHISGSARTSKIYTTEMKLNLHIHAAKQDTLPVCLHNHRVSCVVDHQQTKKNEKEMYDINSHQIFSDIYFCGYRQQTTCKAKRPNGSVTRRIHSNSSCSRSLCAILVFFTSTACCTCCTFLEQQRRNRHTRFAANNNTSRRPMYGVASITLVAL